MKYTIEPMAEKYYAGRAYVHYTAWEETYRGLMPDAILDRRSLEQCLEIAQNYPENTLVAVHEGRVIGFACYLAEARPQYTSRHDAAEIMALYVLREFQGYGVGRALMEACLDRLDRPDVALMVLNGNENAIAFYRRMGFVPTGHAYADDTGYGVLTELEMVLHREIPPCDIANRPFSC